MFKIAIAGKWLKTAVIDSEDYIQPDPSLYIDNLVLHLRNQRVTPDLFTVVQRLPRIDRAYDYPYVIDNLAVLPITGYDNWLTNTLNQHTRRCVRLASRRGLQVRVAPYDDSFVRGIQGIYNETRFRQGRKFWHYGKDFETVKRENETFKDTSEYIGAYDGEELVGFLKMVYVGGYASIMQILSKTSHYDKKPMNALMAKAVELCNVKRQSHLVYRKYTYHKGVSDSLTEFKRRNGFVEVPVPRYFIPLNAKGRLSVTLGLHRGFQHLVPPAIISTLLRLRNKWNSANAEVASEQ